MGYITYRVGPEVYVSHRLIYHIFHPVGNLPEKLTKPLNEPTESTEGISIFYIRRGKVTWPKGLEIIGPCQGNTTSL